MARVCIIGAGAAGLCAARLCRAEGLHFSVFEQTDQIGGTWVYSPQTNTHSSMYEVMQTNLPKEVMAFEGFPFKESLPSFLDHQDVLDYLRQYGEGIPIEFGTKVVRVERSADVWIVSVSKGEQQTQKISFDAVFVCNGHYSMPNEPFDCSHSTSRVLHSHNYRRADDFRDEKVVLIGAGNSGVDIALQLCPVAKEVVLIHHKEGKPLPNMPSNLKQRAEAVAVEGRTVQCMDGLEEDVDSIIICTGYHYSFPFLSQELIQVREGGKFASPLWEHCVQIHYPTSLFLIGLNWTVVPFLLFEAQIRLCLNLFLKRVVIPPIELLQFEENKIRDLKNKGLTPAHVHFLGDAQWDYFHRLAVRGAFQPLDTRVAESIYNFIAAARRSEVQTYKQYNFHVNADRTFTASKK